MDYQTFISRVIPKRFAKVQRQVTVAVEMVGSSITMVSVERIPEEKTLRMAQKPFQSMAEAGSNVRDFISELGSVASLRFVVSFPRHLALLRFLELPAGTRSEIKAMAQWQALPGLPFPAEELISDVWVQARNDKQGTRDVVLAIVRESIITPYAEFFTACGIYPDGFVLSNMGATEYARRSAVSLTGGVLFVEIADDWLNIDILVSDHVVSSRSIPLKMAIKDMPRVIKECRQSLATETALPVEKIVVTSKTAFPIDHALQVLENEFKRPVVHLRCEGQGSDAAVSVLGAASMSAEHAFNFLPTATLKHVASIKIKHQRTQAAKWGLLWIALLVASVGGAIWLKERTLWALDSKIETLAPQARVVADALEQFSSLPSETDVKPLEILRELRLRAPTTVTLHSVSCESDGTCLFQGSAPALSDVTDFAKQMQKSPLLARCELYGSNLRVMQEGQRVEFEIQAQMVGTFVVGHR